MPDPLRALSRFFPATQPLKSPMTETPSVFGALTAKSVL